jgi:hypothetical protein
VAGLSLPGSDIGCPDGLAGCCLLVTGIQSADPSECFGLPGSPYA